jgi:opacity protein-like surface antigen
MNARHSVSAALVLALVTSASAFAQGTSAPRTAEPKWYLAAIGGAVSRPPTGPVFGVEIAENLTRHAQAYANFSYFDNLMDQSLRDGLDARAASLTKLTGDAWSFSGRDRGMSFVAGGRYVIGGGMIRPYVGGGAGIINLKREIVEARLGDVTQAVFNDYHLGEADLSLSTLGVTTSLVEAAFGVGIGSGHTHFDVGYRYRSAFGLTNKLDFSTVTAGIGYRF